MFLSGGYCCTSSRLSGGTSIGFSNTAGCLCTGSAWCTVHKQGLSEGEPRGWGLGIFRWINTADTKGLGSRDLLFSSTLPSISLNPRPSPHSPLPRPLPLSLTLSGSKLEMLKSVITNMWESSQGREGSIMDLLKI